MNNVLRKLLQGPLQQETEAILFPLCVCVYIYMNPSSGIAIGHNNNNIYLLQLGCYPVAVVILHVNKTWNSLLLNSSREGYMRSM